VDGLGLGDGEADGLTAADGVGPGEGGADATVEAAEELNRFIRPTTPTLLSRVARQVSVDSRRRPVSRRAPRRSRFLMADKSTGDLVKRSPRREQVRVAWTVAAVANVKDHGR
jgi:hypothetical protein